MSGCELDSSELLQDPMTVPCEYCTEPVGSAEGGVFLDLISD